MKKIFLFVFVFMVAGCFYSADAQRNMSDLAGHWENSDDNTGTVEFVEGSKVLVSINGLQVPASSYTIDFSRTPIWFDVTVAPNKVVKGLMEFEDDETIKWQVFLSGNFSYDFTNSEADPVFVLKRKK